MQALTTVYFSELLHKKHKALFAKLKSILVSHGYSVKTLKCTKDIWIRDFMPLVTKDGFLQYQYTPDYLADKYGGKIRTNPSECIDELGLGTQNVDLILDGGNIVKYGDTIIMTDKVYTENEWLKNDKKLLESIFHIFKKVIIIPWDKNEPYGHADGMVRFINKDHVLVNNGYNEDFKEKFLTPLQDAGLKITVLQINKITKDSWGYINFLHIGNLIILPAISKVNDNKVKKQLQSLYPDTIIQLCDAKALIKKGGVFNCVSWEIEI